MAETGDRVFARLDGATQIIGAFEHGHSPTFCRQMQGGGQAVMAGSDQNCIKLVVHACLGALLKEIFANTFKSV